MSLRINMVIGYGLTDIQHTDGYIDDPRINPASLLGIEDDHGNLFSMKDFREYVRNELLETKKFGIDYDRTDRSILLNYCRDPVHISDCIVYDGENGLPNVLVLIPPTVQDKWHRRDDVIDYYLAANDILPYKTEAWVKHSDVNFYPYSGFVDSTTGNRVQNPYNDMIRELILESNCVDRQLPIIWKEDLGCSTYNEVMARYTHALPGSLKSLISYTKIFNYPNVIYQLKPVIYCYWC